MLRFLGLGWPMWGLICLGIGLLNTVLYPKELVDLAAANSWFLYFIVRWGHPLVWVLLAASCFVRVLPRVNPLAPNVLAMAGGILYVLFLVVSFSLRPN